MESEESEIKKEKTGGSRSFEHLQSREGTKVNVALAIIEKDGKFLVGRRHPGKHMGGKWEFPGGKVKERESPEECIKREVAEELEAPIDNIKPYFEWDYEFPDGNLFHLTAFRCELVAEPERNVHQELRWASLEELSQLDFIESDRVVLEMLKNAKPAS